MKTKPIVINAAKLFSDLAELRQAIKKVSSTTPPEG